MLPEDKITLRLGSKAFEIVMNNLREQGCTCEPLSIEVAARRTDGTPWTGQDDPELLRELAQGFLLPLIVDHEDRCALSRLAGEANPLDRRATHSQAEALLLESTPALQTGVTAMTKPDAPGEPHLDRTLAGYVEIDEKSEFGQEILARWAEGFSSDERENWSRWTLIDHDSKAKIVLEIVDANLAESDPTSSRGVICFEYPLDRDALLVAGTMNFLLVRAGPAPETSVTIAAENTELVTLSTGDQVLRMIEIMDARNPKLRKNTIRDIMRSLDVAQQFDDSIQLGRDDIEGAVDIIKASKRPLAATTSVFTTMAVKSAVLRAERPLTAREIERVADIRVAVVERILHGEFQEDDPWVLGHQRSDGEWEWVRHPSITGDVRGISNFEGHDLYSADGRLQAARRLLHDMGVEIPVEEISPALAFFKSMIDLNRFETAFVELLHKPPPVWASAKGFAKFMQRVQQQAQLAKANGVERSEQLTYLHLHLGHSMHIAHVLVMDSAQVAVLPKLSEADQLSFARETPLAFDPLFIDFTGDDRMPEIESEISFEGENVKLLGAMVNSDPDPGVLFITPVFYYGNPTAPLMAIALGTYAVNRSGIPDYQFSYVLGSVERFTQPAMTLVAASEILAQEPEIAIEYQRLIEYAAERVLGSLYLLEAANVEMVERELPRRDKKRQEKRGWKIPLVVRVDRPSRRTYNHAVNGNGQHRDYSHQFEVIGHYNHVTKGSMVACIVCNGKQVPDLLCPRCNGIGLDPDKIAPCTRIDVKTGEKTCPHGCRKIWINPYWKGPEDKPMILKTRKIR